MVGLGGAGEDPPVRSGSGGLMPNTSATTAAIRKGVLGGILATLFFERFLDLLLATQPVKICSNERGADRS
jgi:hypothetical protein